MPITDILQMMGRAGRPQFDDSGTVCCLLFRPRELITPRLTEMRYPLGVCSSARAAEELLYAIPKQPVPGGEQPAQEREHSEQPQRRGPWPDLRSHAFVRQSAYVS